MNLIIFLIIISVLIFVHEFGHFFAARRLGIKVEKFSLGFGPQLFSFRFQEVDFKLCAIPFGGYVKLAGDSRQQHTGQQWEYLSRPPGHRARVVFAGPLFNYILSFVVLWLVYCIGYPQISAKVGDVVKDMPAIKAGLQKNDTILSINGKPMHYWQDVLDTIKGYESTEPLSVKALRNNQEMTFSVVPTKKEQKDIFGKNHITTVIGIIPSDDVVKERYGIIKSFWKSLTSTLKMTWLTLQSIFFLIIGYLSFKEAVTGPIGIYHITSGAAHYGIAALLHVTSILSLALAIFNVLPIPVLDGGHILFLGIEKLRKKPMSEKVEQRIGDVGFGFLMILAVFILFNDLIRFGYWDKLNDWAMKWHSK